MPVSSAAGHADGDLLPGFESVEGLAVGQRCQVNPGERRGEIKFIGEVPQLKGGYWVSDGGERKGNECCYRVVLCCDFF